MSRAMQFPDAASISGDDVAKFIGAYQKENGCVSNQTSKDQRLEIIFPTQQ